MLGPVSYSPDLDVFATPPTTPMSTEPPSESIIRPSLSRSSSRPSNLHLTKTAVEFRPDILLESQSPPHVPYNRSPAQVTMPQSMSSSSVVNGRAASTSSANSLSGGSDHNSRPKIPTITTTAAADSTLKTFVTSPHSVTSAPILRPHSHSQSAMTSPCFVHSNLDKGASFSEWLKSSNGLPAVDVAPVLKPMSADSHKTPSRRYRKVNDEQVIPVPYEDDNEENVFDASDYDDDEGSASLTKQLADTAVGVREMSKQLGALLESPSFPPKVLNIGRPHTYQIKYSERADCDQGTRQSSDRAYACPSSLPHEKAQV
jgi:NAD+ kinase